MRRTARVQSIAFLVVLVLASGCQSVERWGTAGEDFAEPGVTHRDEIYRRYGPPLFIYQKPGGGQTLIYSRSRTNRMDFGIRVMVAQFSLGSGRIVKGDPGSEPVACPGHGEGGGIPMQTVPTTLARRFVLDLVEQDARRRLARYFL